LIQAAPIGWWNTGFPLLLLGGLAVVVPWALLPRSTRSQWDVALTVWAAAGVLLLAGAVLFALIYGARGVGVRAAFTQAPLATSWFFLRLSGFAALIWGPLLGLMWLGLAQKVEKRKGEDQMRGNSR
jgi:hypothetical protein